MRYIFIYFFKYQFLTWNFTNPIYNMKKSKLRKLSEQYVLKNSKSKTRHYWNTYFRILERRKFMKYDVRNL